MTIKTKHKMDNRKPFQKLEQMRVVLKITLSAKAKYWYNGLHAMIYLISLHSTLPKIDIP